MIKLILVRHGETFHNRNNVIQGHGPGHLTPKGFNQARKLALYLKKIRIDKIYVSDLQRAVQTAAEIIKYHPNAKVEYDDRIRERNYGVFEGKKGLALHKSVLKSGLPRIHFKPTNGESWMEVYKRARKFLNQAIKKEDGKTILIVSHGGIVRNAIVSLLHDDVYDLSKFRHHNTGMTVIEIDKGKVRLKKLNSIKHLE